MTTQTKAFVSLAAVAILAAGLWLAFAPDGAPASGARRSSRPRDRGRAPKRAAPRPRTAFPNKRIGRARGGRPPPPPARARTAASARSSGGSWSRGARRSPGPTWRRSDYRWDSSRPTRLASSSTTRRWRRGSSSRRRPRAPTGASDSRGSIRANVGFGDQPRRAAREPPLPRRRPQRGADGRPRRHRARGGAHDRWETGRPRRGADRRRARARDRAAGERRRRRPRLRAPGSGLCVAFELALARGLGGPPIVWQPPRWIEDCWIASHSRWV